MILLDDVVQVLDGSMTTAAAKRPFLLSSRNSRGVDRRQIRIDDAALDAKECSEPCEIAVWQHAHRGTPTAGSQFSRLWLFNAQLQVQVLICEPKQRDLS
jgi:hypothetical protein